MGYPIDNLPKYSVVDPRVPKVTVSASISFNQALRVLEHFTEGDKFYNFLRKKRHKKYRKRLESVVEKLRELGVT